MHPPVIQEWALHQSQYHDNWRKYPMDFVPNHFCIQRKVVRDCHHDIETKKKKKEKDVMLVRDNSPVFFFLKPTSLNQINSFCVKFAVWLAVEIFAIEVELYGNDPPPVQSSYSGRHS